MFLRQGIAAVGMRDLMSSANLTQGGFYRHFESKEQLIAEANAAAADRLFARLATRIANQPPAEALQTIISLYLNQSEDKENTYLCPLAMIGVELSHCNQQIRDGAISSFERLVQVIANLLPHRHDNLVRAGGIVSTMVGAVMLANIASDSATAQAILTNAKAAADRLTE